ncbi:MAG: hypothetical protein MUC81_13810 [Bacteroidia bacterium]|jgi:hypothetical protein|nr:hypothetical protein [Bacteroidia bacterium]
MNIFKKYFTSDKDFKENLDSQENYELISEAQVDFANGAIEIFNPLLRQFGFKLFKLKITEYGTTIIWIKNKCFIELSSYSHPYDAPSYYGIVLGEFKTDYYHYADLDCVGLWRLKAIQENLAEVNDNPFPFGVDIQSSLIQTKEDLLKYGKGFLQGDLREFYYARNKQWNQ